MSEIGAALFAQLDTEDLVWLRAALGVVMLDAMEPDPLLTTRDAAVMVGVSLETIRRHARKGSLEAEHTGAHYRIRKSSLQAWMRGERKPRPTSSPQDRRPRPRSSSSTMSDAFKRAA